MALYKLGDNVPAIDVSAFIAAAPTIIGNVTLKKKIHRRAFKFLMFCSSLYSNVTFLGNRLPAGFGACTPFFLYLTKHP